MIKCQEFTVDTKENVNKHFAIKRYIIYNNSIDCIISIDKTGFYSSAETGVVTLN